MICAKALCGAFGGQVVTLEMHGRPQHYGAIIQGTRFDFDGPAESGDIWAERFAESEVVDGPLRCEDGFLPNPEVPFCQETSNAIRALLLEATDEPSGSP